MKKTIVLFLLMCAVGVSPAFAEKPLGVDRFTSVDELAGAVAAYFPKVQGTVTAIQGKTLTLTLTRRDGLTPGMELTLWRDGQEILHPVTGKVIGHREDEVGTVEVVAANDASSTAVMKKKVRDPKAGDKARITPKQIALAIIPLTPGHAEIVQGLADRLKEYGRFSVLDGEKVAGFLNEKKRSDSSLIKEMGGRYNLDAVVALSVFPTEGKLLVMARIFYTADASTLDTIIATLDSKQTGDTIADVKPFFMPAKEERNATPELPVDVRFVTAADFDGDGKLEYAFSDGSALHVYREETSGWREVWTETLPPESEGFRQINIDSADINGNGRPEIFVTAMMDGKVFSYVIEVQDGSYRRIADVPGFLRTLVYPGKGTLLLGQAYDPATFYADQPHVYAWQGGKYAAGTEFPLPAGVTLYGFTFADFGEAQPLLVSRDDDDRLLVYSKGHLIWKSEEEYPAVDTFVYKPVTGVGAVLAQPALESDKSQRVRIRGRIAAADMNADGRDEILLPKNISGTLVGGFVAAEMDGLSWTGARLEQQWNIKDIPGPVLDFQLLQQDKNVRILSLVRTQGGLFTKDRQQVLTYSVK
jgi:hypothetical protein